jgi:predicted GNAT family acetyltransferase
MNTQSSISVLAFRPMEVRHVKPEQRFEVVVDGRRARLEYFLMDPDVLDIRSTFVPQQIRGQGIGQRMVEAAISFAKEQQLQVRASCWYARELINSGRVQC